MSATLEKTVAHINWVDNISQVPNVSNVYAVKAIEPEVIPPHTMNRIKVGLKGVNVTFEFKESEDAGKRGLVVLGANCLYRDEDEVFEAEVPVWNLTNDNVNIRVWDYIADMWMSETDGVIELDKSEWDWWTGYGIHESVEITVTDWTDPIEGASVSIDGGTAKTTNASWVATFSNITKQSHTVAATATGFENFSDTVDLSSDDDATIEMTAVTPVEETPAETPTETPAETPSNP